MVKKIFVITIILIIVLAFDSTQNLANIDQLDSSEDTFLNESSPNYSTPTCRGGSSSCRGYQIKYLGAYGNDNPDKTFVPYPKNATPDMILPMCSVYSYDTYGDNDLSYQCTWEHDPEQDGYYFTLSLDHAGNGNANVKAIAMLIDMYEFVLFDSFEFTVYDDNYMVDPDLNIPQGSYPVLSINSYYTAGADEFEFKFGKESHGWYGLWLDGGNGSSFVKGGLYVFKPLGEDAYMCSEQLDVLNQKTSTDMESCYENAFYKHQDAVMNASIGWYEPHDKDWDVDCQATFAEIPGVWRSPFMSCWQDNGNSDSFASIQGTVFGYMYPEGPVGED
jgi:hypothetical protein